MTPAKSAASHGWSGSWSTSTLLPEGWRSTSSRAQPELKERWAYHYLFGPVSISAEYLAVSRGLLAVFLERNLMARDLAGLVRPRHGFRPSRRLLRQALGPVTDLDELTSLITHVEPDQKGIPVLLRQYLKLGAQVLGLNVDPEFSGVLDALVLVDLARTDQRILGRHMGQREATAFRTLHGTHLAA